MKLKEFNIETCITQRVDSSVPIIGINIKVGLFRFNSKAVELIGLKDGDEVVFLQDEEEPTNWYISKVKTKGFAVRHKENIGKGVLFNNSKLAREIADSVEFKGNSGKCLIAGTPTKLDKRDLWGILTGGLINQ